MSPRSEATGQKITSLDGLRGFAVLAVMLHHSANYNPTDNLINRVIRGGLSLGWIGVDLFFVLSGFLITGILLNTRNCRNYFSSFWCRRALRILPLSYGFLLLALAVFPRIVQPGWLPAKADYWLYPTYLMNWLPLWHEPWHANILGHFWSLCIEEQFYLVWPLLVLFLNPRALPRVLVALGLLTIAGRGWWVWNYGPNDFIDRATITRADSLLAGALCACLLHRQQITRRVTSMLGFVALILLSSFVAIFYAVGGESWEVFVREAGFPILAVAFSALLVYTVQTDHEPGWMQTILRCRPLTSLGKIAYGVYIFHVPVFYFVDVAFIVANLMGRFVLLKFVLKYCLSIGIASMSFEYFERPFLLMKDRFRPEYSPPPKTASLAATD
jgi:peptidoglycan/LPS O-acetylase OafA/YrhL